MLIVGPSAQYCSSADEPVIKHRTFDPSTRTLKKHENDEDVEMDTVEKNVEGLAEQIIEEDAERRAQDLVSSVGSPLGSS